VTKLVKLGENNARELT